MPEPSSLLKRVLPAMIHLTTRMTGRQVASMQDRSSKRPKDASHPAKPIADIAMGEVADGSSVQASKNPAAVALGRLGGEKGGKARAAKLTSEERSRIAARAAAARWKHDS